MSMHRARGERDANIKDGWGELASRPCWDARVQRARPHHGKACARVVLDAAACAEASGQFRVVCPA